MQMIVEGIILYSTCTVAHLFIVIHRAVCLGTKGETKTMQREQLACSHAVGCCCRMLLLELAVTAVSCNSTREFYFYVCVFHFFPHWKDMVYFSILKYVTVKRKLECSDTWCVLYNNEIRSWRHTHLFFFCCFFNWLSQMLWTHNWGFTVCSIHYVSWHRSTNLTFYLFLVEGYRFLF